MTDDFDEMKEYSRGFFWLQPRPNFKHGRQWSRGKGASCSLIVLSIPVIIFVAGFVIGRDIY